jgi:hypothetical protein
MKLPWITLAENDITGYFDSLTRKVFLKKDIYQMLSEKHQIWGLRRTMSVDTFIEQIKEIGLEELRLTSPNYDNTYTRFIWGKNVPIYQLSLSLRPHSYFTHHSAMHILGLSSQTATGRKHPSRQGQGALQAMPYRDRGAPPRLVWKRWRGIYGPGETRSGIH